MEESTGSKINREFDKIVLELFKNDIRNDKTSIHDAIEYHHKRSEFQDVSFYQKLILAIPNNTNARNFQTERYEEISTYCRTMIARRRSEDLSFNAVRKLTIGAVALMEYYLHAHENGKGITATNADKIAKSHGFDGRTSGKKLLKHYDTFTNDSDRNALINNRGGSEGGRSKKEHENRLDSILPKLSSTYPTAYSAAKKDREKMNK